jgi:hypothetical protein
MKKTSRITTPPTENMVKCWVIERYGDDFEPKFLDELIYKYLLTINNHNEYSKKRTIKYISENIFNLERIYRKQELSYWIKRGWNEKTAAYKRIIRNKEWYINMYGEIDGLLMYNKKNDNISNNCGHTLEKYIKRYGENEGKFKYDNYKRTCARNLTFFITKYGEIEGKIKYKNFKKHIGKASKQSLLVFKPLVDWLINYVDINDIYYGDNNSREFFIVKDGKTYLYDFTIKKLNIIIEFNGVKFHVNESWSDRIKENWVHPFKKINYFDAIENDKFKNKLAREFGFTTLTIWSDTPIEENINICKNFIKSYINEE